MPNYIVLLVGKVLIKKRKIYFTLTMKKEMDANAFINGARDFIGTVLE